MTWIDSHAPRKFPDHQISPPQRTEGDDLVALFHHATHLKGWGLLSLWLSNRSQVRGLSQAGAQRV